MSQSIGWGDVYASMDKLITIEYLKTGFCIYMPLFNLPCLLVYLVYDNYRTVRVQGLRTPLIASHDYRFFIRDLYLSII